LAGRPDQERKVSQPNATAAVLAPHATLSSLTPPPPSIPTRETQTNEVGRSAKMGAGDGEVAASKDKASGGGAERTSLDGVRDKNVMQLKKLNTALFPVRYNEKYYQDAIASKDFSKLGAPSNPLSVHPPLFPALCHDFSLEPLDLRLGSKRTSCCGEIEKMPLGFRRM
jgi:hypothetical protein